MYNADEWLYLEEFSLVSAEDFPSKVKGKKNGVGKEYSF